MKKRLQFQGFGAAHFAAALVAVFTFALSIPAAAQWVSSTTANNTVGVAGSEQRKPLIIADGQGGSIIVWEDDRASATERTDIYAQKLDARGNPVWAVNGVLVCAGVGLEDQILFNIASDEQGGVLVVWKDGRGGAMATEYYIQRILANGTRNWGNGGVPIENVVDDGNPTDVAVAGFGTGGAIVAWTEGQNNQNLKVQRFEDDGSPDWGPNIIRTDVLGNFAQEVQMINDGAGGVIITWSDERSGNFDIYAQRVLISSGALGGGVWSSTPNGISLHAGPQAGDQIKPHLVRNGAGGAIAAWDDVATTNIYAATITQTGALFGNIPVCTATGVQSESQLTVDGNGGAIITWSDQRGGNSDIYAQRLISSGTVAWILNGVAVCTIGADQNRPAIVGDKDGGAIISWTDARISTANTGIYAQHLRSDGTLTPGWLTTGVAVGTAGNNQLDAVVAADETGGAVVAWSDERSGAGAGDIFASLVGGYRVVLTADGGDGSLRQAITSANAAPGRIHFAIPASPFTITPATILPSISGEGIVVDGYSQIGSSPNTLAAGSNANILVEINTTASGGFNVSGDNVKIRGLSIFGSGSGSGVFTLSSSGLSVDGCFLGLRADGTTPGALGNGVNSSGSNLLVGGPNVADRNVITGNTNAGILSSDGINLTITNNIIGLDKTGEVSVGAQPKGISIAGINSGNILIGGALAGQGNLISNNSVAGIDFTNITNAANTRVFGNIIGLDKNATNRPTGGSQATGINSTGSQSNVGIGGVNAGEGNTISGNTVVGVSFNAGSTVLMSNIRVQGNSIGLQKNGSSPITSGSQQYGVRFNLSVGTLSNAIVGDNGLGGRNTIADNTADGLDLNGAGVGSVLIGGNSIYNNAQKGIRLSGGANAGIIAPVVASVSTTSITGTITGTGAANKIIRVYTGKDDEGRKLLGQIQVPNGSSNWTLNGSFSLSDSITATYTDIDRTSAFSAALAAPASLPTWTLSNSGIGAGNLNGVAATLSRIITVGNTGKIYLSIDGALTWTLVGNGITANNLNDIVIPSNANSSGKGTGAAGTQGFGSAVAVGVGGTILRSNDGGSSWASVPSGSTNELNSVATAPDFTDSTLAKGTGTAGTQGFGSAVAVGVGGTILRSADGGDTWSTTTVGSAELNGVSVNGGFELRATAAKGTSTSGTFGVNGFGSAVAVGVGGTILRSDNGGDTWSTTTVGSSDLNGVSFTPNFEPLAAGSRGKGTSTSGTFGVNGFGSAVAVGVGGTILRSSDGANWLNVSSNVAGGAVGNDLLSVQMVSESEGYISGTSGLVLKTIDGGVNWTPQSIPTSSDLNDIAVLADGSGFTAGDNQTLLVTNNSGDQTLPVSLLAFTASSSVINGFGAANLAWSTESETDNAGFSVMRRENTLAGALEGFKLVANYLSILTLQGGGSTTSQKDYRYTDDGVSIGSEYFYRLRSHDYSGTVHDYPIIATVRIEAAGSPKTYKYELRQNYPNPFNPQTTIAYTLQNAGQVQLELFNTLGQKVKVIDSGFRSAGEYRVTLGSDNLSSGMYFYRLVAASERGMIVQTKKLLIVK